MILESALILSLANQCQSNISTDIVQKLISVESGGDPFAIAIKGVPIIKQPKSKEEAISAIKQLDSLGFNYSVGLMQVNHTNFKKYGLTIDSAFDYCPNIKAGSEIFADCLNRAKVKYNSKSESQIINHAASCYYSGNFTYGFKKEGSNNVSYVEKFNGVRTNTHSPEKIKSHRIQNESNNTPEIKKSSEPWDVFGDFAK
ncbi:lytic transglycosylase domain-containing protein (plasmid) [Photobacterium leiognathi subsp. mandapamensis]|uniref:lytic transglycosylase domain-containing protein n=1 Tax=Photobacterium leiognathi TaxID=553611 RepID=UPI003AF3E4A4